MKTMKKNDTIIRVSEKNVSEKLSLGYTYTSKKDWKDNSRVAKKATKVVDVEENKKKLKSK